MDELHRQQLHGRLDWLAGARERHARTQRRAPYALALALLAIPGHLIWGLTASLWIVVVALSLAAMLFYIAWNHEKECDVEAAAVRAMLDAPPTDVAPAPESREARKVARNREFDHVRQPRRYSL